MNAYLLIIIILIFFLSICTIYLIAYRKQVNEIMKKEGEDAYRNIISFRDLKNLYNAYRNNKNLSIYERQILIKFFITSIISLVMYIIFGIMVFVTNW